MGMKNLFKEKIQTVINQKTPFEEKMVNNIIPFKSEENFNYENGKVRKAEDVFKQWEARYGIL